MLQNDNSLLIQKLKDRSLKKEALLVNQEMRKLHSFSPFIKYNNNKESIILLVKRHFLRE